ncbi:GDP-L-fucose synthase family protein [Croceimicrobium hydrocarbonivorans]|uniref:GDP-L-fucose synthase n=1 Tax=Croceimicrobium hydrocarbonivorans TaxID=2761580 RepID=A0A7H0VGA3_9FLAO|nr:GDP-L-fucose synthase [Croceimicrobium hydrocarbonivorans]QNR24751.1 GDP-L-fucose synthase [Croceimicrobium hydrocarbonivorans]
MKIYIAGHRGMVGSAIWRHFENSDQETELIGKSSKELDLRNQAAVADFIASEKPDVIIDAAARVGGILANNDYPYQFLMENMQIQNNLISASIANNIQKFVFLGSSCIYPKLAPQPLKEEHLLTGSLEPTNEWYAIAKISGVKVTESIRKQFGYDYVSLMPTNLYGPFDNFDLQTSHVLPAMIRKFHEAKENGHAPVGLWGSGSPMREFLHVDDLAKAVGFAVRNRLEHNLYNVGSGSDLSIKELAENIQKVVGHQGEIQWDTTKPDGTPRKWMDSSLLRAMGWAPEIGLEEGIRDTYQWFQQNINQIKEVKLT